MTTAPAQNPTPGIVISTAQGDQTLDRLAAGLVKDCDGSPAGIADVLERVLSADLVDTLNQTSTRPPTAQQADENHEHEIWVTAPPPESPDQATRRRLTQGGHLISDSMSAPAQPCVRR